MSAIARSGTLWPLLLLALGGSSTACGGEQGTDNDHANGSDSGGNTASPDDATGGNNAIPHDATGGKEGTGGSAPASTDFADLDCASPWPGYKSCSSSTRCMDSQSSFADAVQASICLPELGMYPSDDACSGLGMLGRCFTVANEYWLADYRNGTETTAEAASRAETLGAQCEESGGIWCENPFGVSPETAAHCKAICAVARPDYSSTPECDWNDNCESSCWQAANDAGCDDCISISFWDTPGCNDFECQCPPPVFEQE